MPLQIRFVRLTLTVDIPVLTRTDEEAIALACDVVGDKLGIDGDAPPVALAELVECVGVSDKEAVWGEAVPEDHMELGQLREWLKTR
jgi:hypothetical protein